MERLDAGAEIADRVPTGLDRRRRAHEAVSAPPGSPILYWPTSKCPSAGSGRSYGCVTAILLASSLCRVEATAPYNAALAASRAAAEMSSTSDAPLSEARLSGRP